MLLAKAVDKVPRAHQFKDKRADAEAIIVAVNVHDEHFRWSRYINEFAALMKDLGGELTGLESDCRAIKKRY